MNRYTAQKLTLAAAVASLLTGCLWSGNRYLPICVVNDRTRPSRDDVTDVYAVSGENELRRHTITPVEEYFVTLGRPSRPDNVWRCYPGEGAQHILWEDSAISRAWQRGGATHGVAITPYPPRRTTNTADARKVSFPLQKKNNPPGTNTLIIRMTDFGLQSEPSRVKLKKPKKK